MSCESTIVGMLELLQVNIFALSQRRLARVFPSRGYGPRLRQCNQTMGVFMHRPKRRHQVIHARPLASSLSALGACYFILACLPQPAHAGPMADCASSRTAAKNGSFDKAVRVELLPDGRDTKLLEAVSYTDPCGQVWRAPAGSVVNGASIPRVAWSIVGGPYEGRYRDASVIHDVACDQRNRPWQSVHEVFYFAMLARDTPYWQAKVMYAAVYHFGPRWKALGVTVEPPSPSLTEDQFRSLADEIRRRESGLGAVPVPPMSLQEIEEWPTTALPKN